MKIHSILTCFALLPWIGGLSYGAVGDPNDLYVVSDLSQEVFQYDRQTLAYVPGNFPGTLGGQYSQVFSNGAQMQGNLPYFMTAAGTSEHFFVGSNNGVIELTTTGSYVQTIGSGFRVYPVRSPNDNFVVGGPTGTEEYNSATGAFVRTVEASANGFHTYAFQGNEMFVGSTLPGTGPLYGIRRFDFTTGLPSNPTIPIPFDPQEIRIGPDNNLYANSFFTNQGIWQYNFGTSTWTQVINSGILGLNPHGFDFDPVNNDLYVTYATGELNRYDFTTFALLGLVDHPPSKLTDVMFKRRPCPTNGNLADLIANHGKICNGDKKFSDFQYHPMGDMPDASLVDVVSITDAHGNLGIRFIGPFVDQFGGGASEALLEYTVMVTDPSQLISDVHLAANANVVGEQGYAAITETFLPDDPHVLLEVYDIQPGGRQLVDWADLTVPVSMLRVQKDITLFGATSNSLATISFIDQSFSQIPEPMSAIAFFSGIAMLRTVAWRRRRNAVSQ